MKIFQKILPQFVGACLAMLLFSCNNGEVKQDEKKADETVNADTAKVEQPVVPAFMPFKIFMVRHAVADFDKWKAGYLAHDSMRQAYGISQFIIGRGIDDPKTAIVIDKISDVQKAKDFSMLPDLKDAMKKAGVTGKPEFAYADVIRNDDSKIEQQDRMMVSHHVKDFDAWLKVYDAEGVAKRMENGMIDRGMARGIDDPNMVYLVFAISDMAKAKARGNSDELKKLMTDAGVDSKPTIFFYKIVN
jgi:hypothetical protein